MEFHTTGDGVVEYLPADEEPPAAISQIWCLDMKERRWRVDMMIEPGTLDTWIYKRQPSISRPRAEMVDTTAEGIPYLKPAAVLLFKATDAPRMKSTSRERCRGCRFRNVCG
ncbi:phage terminase large subunit-like protein [Rhizobium tibeticum]|nr:phage terminase large subunit-like protein [Rhizobium tibeticum]